MNKVFIQGKGKRGKRISEEIRAHNLFRLVESRDEADGIIIATPPETHVAMYEAAQGKKVLIEKPLCLSGDDAEALRNGPVMVGDNYIFSDCLIRLREILDESHADIRAIRSFWLKNVNLKTNVKYDLGYHHIYINDFLRGEKFSRLQYSDITDKSSIIVLDYKSGKSVISVSHSQNIEFYLNDICVETSAGSYYVRELGNILSLHAPDGHKVFESDTGLKNLLQKFNDFIEGRYVPDISTDINIIKALSQNPGMNWNS